ncbi:MAG: hypothetical protein ACK4TI_03785 [Nitrososphaerales archaeon]
MSGNSKVSSSTSLIGRSLGAGILGGIIGAIVMSLILVSSKVMIGLPMLADFIVMGTFVGGIGEAAIGSGLAAHFLVGAADGAIFGAIVASTAKLRLMSWGKALALGLSFGLIVWLIVFVPVTIVGFAPIMMAMMGPAAADMLPMVLVLGFIGHLLFGAVVAVTVFATTRARLAERH